MRCLVSLSGGMDSATVLSLAIERYGKDEVGVVLFDYGSKHNKFERQAALAQIDHHGIGDVFLIPLQSIFSHIKSNLLMDGGDIPEGHYEHESMKLTVVPGRNTIFNSILMGIAQSEGAEYVSVGIHAGDHAIYPDCRPEYYRAMQKVFAEATEDKVRLLAPFLDYNKAGILGIGFEIGTPYHLTRTCYKHQELSCGKCGACQERLEAFRKVGKLDPIKYAK